MCPLFWWGSKQDLRPVTKAGFCKLGSEEIQTGCETQEPKPEAEVFCRKSLNGRRRNYAPELPETKV
jgi:hypothetical protein